MKETVVDNCMYYAGKSVEILRKNEKIHAAVFASANNTNTHLPTNVTEITDAPNGWVLV